jgi:uncharacterized damage-inducible protein DinB
LEEIMAFNQALLPEFDMEMTKTRSTLERVPEDKFGWKPHPKSMTLGALANHVVNIPGWGVTTIKDDSFDVATGAQPSELKSRKELLERFDKNVTDVRAAIAGANDEHLKKPWSLLKGGEAIFTQPRIALLRGFIMNHLIHHRAQLGVYLRLNDVPVPSIYGPSADEGNM